jgi:uncharacterized ion transporter superfamily protein YfcC
MKSARFPDSLVLIFAMILLAQAASYLLPAGEFDRVEAPGSSRLQVVPGSYHRVDAEPLPPYAFLTAIPRGMGAAADIIMLVFLVGGAIGVIRATGVFDALIATAIRRFSTSPTLLVAGMVTLFALGSSTIGMGEEYIPFVPVLVAMCVALGMDAIVALALLEVGLGIGHGCAATNPFTVVLAQEISGVPLYSGQAIRWGLLVVCLGVGVHHVMRYGRRVMADPSRSLVAGLNLHEGVSMDEEARFTAGRVVILSAFAAGIAFFVFGVAQWGWFLTELSAVFLAITLIAAVAGRLTPNRAAKEFGKGAADLTMAALLIGFARAIEVVLDAAMVKDTIINGVAGTLEGLPAAVAAVGMLGVQSAINFLIPSGSGQAYVTMPIMAPLADLAGLSREIAVLAYQFGDGFMNMIVPTSPVLMGLLGMARIPYVKWARFIAPLIGKLMVVAAVVLVVLVGISR